MANIVVVRVPFRHLANFRTAAAEFRVRVEPISPFDEDFEQSGEVRYYVHPFSQDEKCKSLEGHEYYAFLGFLRNLALEGVLVTQHEHTPKMRASYAAYFGEDGLRQLESL